MQSFVVHAANFYFVAPLSWVRSENKWNRDNFLSESCTYLAFSTSFLCPMLSGSSKLEQFSGHKIQHAQSSVDSQLLCWDQYSDCVSLCVFQESRWLAISRNHFSSQDCKAYALRGVKQTETQPLRTITPDDDTVNKSSVWFLGHETLVV